jgi:hypothetical protein
MRLTTFAGLAFAASFFIPVPEALASTTTDRPGGFVESPLEPGVWLRRDEVTIAPPKPAAEGSLPSPPNPPNPSITPKMASPGVSSIPGFNDPGAIVAVGTTLYVGNDAPSVTVVDASVPGSEAIAGAIATPIHPIDLAVTGGVLYVADQGRDEVWYQSLGALGGGTWSVIHLPAATTEWTYGNICFPHPTLSRLYVIQMWENRIQVIDLVTKTVQTPITELHHLPTSIAFSSDGARMAVLCTGLSAPSCGAFGPNLAVFDATTHAKLYEIDLQGTCARAIAVDGDDAFVVRDTNLRKYDLPTGGLLDSLALGGGRNAAHNGFELVTQDGSEKVRLHTSDFEAQTGDYDVVFGAQVWFPPIEEMVALPSVDGRVFVTCRNDDAISVIRHDSGCFPYGVGCAGSGGFTPRISSQGCPHLGQNFDFAITRGLGGALVSLFAGSSQGNLPLGGGCSFLVSPVLPPLFTVPLSGSGAGNGSLALSVAVPPTLPAGISIALQAIVHDPAGPIAAAVSNGLALVVK